MHAGSGILTMHRFLAFVLGIFIAGGVNAMWAGLSDEELVRSADLIVLAEWRETIAQSGSAVPATRTGSLVVSEVLKGAGSPVTVRVAQPASDGPRSSSDLVFRPGDRGLWLLRKQPGSKDLYLIDHPQRFIPAAGGEVQIRRIKELLAR